MCAREIMHRRRRKNKEYVSACGGGGERKKKYLHCFFSMLYEISVSDESLDIVPELGAELS